MAMTTVHIKADDYGNALCGEVVLCRTDLTWNSSSVTCDKCVLRGAERARRAAEAERRQSAAKPVVYFVQNYTDASHYIIAQRETMNRAEAIDFARETPHSTIDTRDELGWVLRTEYYSPKHPVAL